MKEVIGLLFITIIGWLIWSNLFGVDYSEPWWTGNERQQVCTTAGSGYCYYEVVSSDGENIDGLNAPNGNGYIEGASSECVKASQLKGSRLCRMWDSDGVKWDIMKE